MKQSDILKNAFAMPISRPAYPRGPYRFVNREFFIVTYETDLDILKEVVPEPLEVTEPVVKFEFIRMPDSTGFGDYTESGQVIPVTYQGKKGGYVHAMYLDDEAPIAAGREIWGFPKKLAKPSLRVNNETLIGKLNYEELDVAVATMGYKYITLDNEQVRASLLAPSYLLKIIPHVDGTPRICELVEYYLENLTVKGAWSGPADIALTAHAMAPVADLPVRKVISASHIVTDLTLPYGKVVYDYMKK
ncbi:putative acetoacetate decarboxylase [Aquicella siphonis]|uniref:Putative acetoacetate decarboxylase n=1 Tax=Aquicella siphonis TaxID=254247 RepID=A0A5E4PGY2_9COXI|nr:acetoacetate decarboxylase [Aquicella siphonis]VVC75845.1 putative acetoacetate decarboxylase [Aquicella siphonis]